MFGSLKRSAVTGLINLEMARLRRVSSRATQLAPSLPFPANLDELASRPDWSTDGLREAGVIPRDATITRFNVEPFAETLAFRSTLGRLCVEWVDPATGEGAVTVIAKMAPRVTDIHDHAIYLLQKNHEKEVGFYDLDAGDSGLAPTVYRCAVDPPSGHFCILMKYYEGYRSHSESDGCSPEDAFALASGLARFHARHWGIAVAKSGWLQPPPSFMIDWLTGSLQGPERDVLMTVARKAWRHNLSGPQTLLHGDCRVGNVMFAPTDGSVLCYDWQAARTGRGVFDLVYFASLSLTVQTRTAILERLLDRYHEGLVAHGVTGYSRAMLADDAFNSELLTGFFVTAPFMSKEASSTEENVAGIKELGDAWAKRIMAVLREHPAARVAAWCGLSEDDILRARELEEAKAAALGL